MVHHGPHQHLKGGRGTQSAAAQHPGGGVGVESAHGVAHLPQARGHPPHHGHGAARLGGPDRQIVQGDLRHPVIPGLDAHQVGPVGRGAGDGVQIDTARQTAAPLVVGVVAAQLRPSGNGKQEDVLLSAGKDPGVSPDQVRQPPGGPGGILAINRFQPVQKSAALQGLKQFFPSHSRPPPCMSARRSGVPPAVIFSILSYGGPGRKDFIGVGSVQTRS